MNNITMNFSGIRNITVDGIIQYSQITTQKCMDWCKQQHYANDYQNLWVFAIVLIALCIAHTIFRNSDVVSKRTGYTEDQLAMIVMHLIDFSILAITGFFVWFLWFK